VYGAVPPLGTEIPVPLQSPKHNTSVEDKLACNGNGSFTSTVATVIQPELFVTVAAYVPAHNPFTVLLVEAEGSFQTKEHGASTQLNVTFTVPSQTPLQLASVEVSVSTSPVTLLTGTVCVTEHPFPSVMVAMYAPAHNAVAVAVV
jgi:hypothetical protein